MVDGEKAKDYMQMVYYLFWIIILGLLLFSFLLFGEFVDLFPW